LVGSFPVIDFSLLSKYEKEDNSEGAKELACSSGVCMLDDVIMNGKGTTVIT
jgi:hypothetical protein